MEQPPPHLSLRPKPCHILHFEQMHFRSIASLCLLKGKINMWRTLARKAKHVFVAGLEWLPARGLIVCEWKKLPSPWRKSSLCQESKHLCSTQDKTSQQEKERDKWRSGKSVLVWRGLLKPHPWAYQEERPEVFFPRSLAGSTAIHTLVCPLRWGANRCTPFMCYPAGDLRVLKSLEQLLLIVFYWSCFVNQGKFPSKWKPIINLQSCKGLLASVSPRGGGVQLNHWTPSAWLASSNFTLAFPAVRCCDAAR